VLEEINCSLLTGFIIEKWCLLRCYACGSCKNDVSEELSASFIRLTRIGELGTTLAATSNGRTLRRIGISLQRASVASYS
jgi:hypothetical protein